MTTKARTKLREILESNNATVCAPVFDPLSVRMADDLGMKIGILGGSVASLMELGAPDIYLLTLNELAEHAARITRAADLPLIVDGDSGYGNSLNVMRTIEELEKAGASLVTIEDTIIPQPFKRDNLGLSSIEEACTKLEAALAARKDSGMAIFARTNANQPLDQLIERVEAYGRIGVDGICLFGCTDKERLAQWSRVSDLPIMLISYGELDLGSDAELVKQNVRIIFNGHNAYVESVRAVYASLCELSGTPDASVVLSSKEIIKKYSHDSCYRDMANKYVSKTLNK